jgi:hypothetical protein
VHLWRWRVTSAPISSHVFPLALAYAQLGVCRAAPGLGVSAGSSPAMRACGSVSHLTSLVRLESNRSLTIISLARRWLVIGNRLCSQPCQCVACVACSLQRITECVAPAPSPSGSLPRSSPGHRSWRLLLESDREAVAATRNSVLVTWVRGNVGIVMTMWVSLISLISLQALF